MRCSSEFVTFLGGPTLPREAVELAIDLDLRGVSLIASGHQLAVSPRERLTEADVVAIRRWKLQLLALVVYAPPSPVGVQ